MSVEKGVCYTCGWYSTAGSTCKHGVADRPRGGAARFEPCGWWKRKRKSRGEAE